MPKGKAIVGQSGGPTSVINASLAGVIEAARAGKAFDGLLGMRWGIEGLMDGTVIDLLAEDPATVAGLRATPSSALGSCRHKLADADFPILLDRLEDLGVHTLFLIGGNDSMDTIHRVCAYAGEQGYELLGVGVPKTVDNDLYGTDHTPGYPSAARYTALSVQQAGTLARDMQKVDQYVIYQSIGRDAGWLTAAGALAKRAEDDPPHLVYLPERPFHRERFLADAQAAQERFGYVSIVCGEGLKYADGTPVSASRTRDGFANVEYGAMGGASVGLNLHRMISEAFGWRGEFQITESLPMSAIDRAVQRDLDEAYACGREAVRLAAAGTGGVMVTLAAAEGPDAPCTLGTAPLHEVAVRAKPMPDEMINEAGNFPTRAFLDYAGPLVGPLPEFARLQGAPVARGD